MKKVLVIAVVSCALLAACFKNLGNGPTYVSCTPVSASDDEAKIKAFCAADSVDYTKYAVDTNYIYYHYSAAGSGPSATASSVIFFEYKLTLLDGTVIGQSATPIQSAIVNLIPAFQLAAPLFKKGTHIQMVVPSILAYACTGSSSIPANTILHFDVTITDLD